MLVRASKLSGSNTASQVLRHQLDAQQRTTQARHEIDPGDIRFGRREPGRRNHRRRSSCGMEKCRTGSLMLSVTGTFSSIPSHLGLFPRWCR